MNISIKLNTSKIILSIVTIGTLGFTAQSQINFEGIGATSTPSQFSHFMQSQRGEMAYADVDSDGDMDVLIMGEYSGSSTNGHANLYLNDGQGSFYSKVNHGITGRNYSRIDFGDIDGDNDPDLIVTGSTPSGTKIVELYTNDGTGMFTIVTSTTINPGYRGEIKFIDIDGDSDLDIYVSGDTPTGVNTSLHLNDGSGNFALATGIPFIGLTGSAFDFADIDGDNDLDILITGVDGSGLKLTNLFLNDGNGGFTLDASANFENVGWGTVVFEDIDGDNDMDVVIAGALNTAGVNATLFYKNDGNGNFTLISTGATALVTPAHVGSITFADFNNDGDKDLFITGITLPANNRITELYDNDGNGNFTLNTTSFAGVRFSSSICIDFNNDNNIDLMYLGQDASSSITKYYINDGSGVLEQVPGTPFSSLYSGDIDFADIDGDNDLDLLISGRKTGSITSLYENDGNGIYTLIPTTPFTNTRTGSNAFADVDGDGDLDVLITGVTSTSVTVSNLYINDGNGNFNLSANSISNVRNSAVAFADIDGDNDLDLLITGTNQTGASSSAISELYLNDGSGIFSLVSGTPFFSVEYSTTNFADVDGDNDLDVLITGRQNNGIPISRLYINDGSGAFTISTGASFINIEKAGVDFADVDGDNDLDVLLSGLTNTVLYQNDGNGNYSIVSGTPFTGVASSSVKFTDLDGDNDLDVLICGNGNVATGSFTGLYTNDGLGNYTLEINQPFIYVNQGAITFGDIDGDGDTDLAMMGLPSDGQESSSLFRNTTCIVTSISITTSIINQTITANENSSGVTYQWLNCDGYSVINGETLQNFTATTNGDFACEITKGCTVDTTLCTNISGLGIENNTVSSELLIYPNPTNGELNIKISGLNIIETKIVDITGKVVFTTNLINNSIDVSSLTNGIYFLQVQTKEGLLTQKFIKE